MVSTSAPRPPDRVWADRSAIDGVQRAALAWYVEHGRPLAFRTTSDPWAVLVSEVMAQQTQAQRAATAWQAFILRFPTPGSFADVTPADAIRAWRGLGYNRRAIALREAAIRIVELHDGEVPGDLEALQALPGIGPYTSRAVLAIAFGRPVAALDTNIARVLERALGGLPAGARNRQSFADTTVPANHAADWTHALMDVGATFCLAREARCDACPLRSACAAARGLAPLATSSRRTRRAGKPPAFPTTSRWLRGRILDRLRDAPDGTWTTFDRSIGEHDPPAVARAVAALASERLVELDGPTSTTARLATG